MEHDYTRVLQSHNFANDLKQDRIEVYWNKNSL